MNYNMTQQKEKANYRPDIDGLRALACLSVVFYHAYPWTVTGGFTGVDVFFVISGYLISLILYRNLFSTQDPGSVNIIDFYIRRVKRIFPALLLILICCMAAGWFILLPEEYQMLGKHTFGGAVYISNFILYDETGSYFDFSSNSKLLLHLWSLGIEEQFYLVFPLFLLLLYKVGRGFNAALAGFTLLSFCACILEIQGHNQPAAFYLPWCRFWELSSGALLARLIHYPNRIRDLTSRFDRPAVRHFLSLAGLALMITGIIMIDRSWHFPGFSALLPVCGACMIITAGKDAVVNRFILGNRVAVFLGLISYPLYLWHWPLLSLNYIYEGRIAEDHEKIIIISTALLLSVLTFRYVERPLRYGRYPAQKAAALLAVLLAVGACGYAVAHSSGVPSRFGSEYGENLSAEEISNRDLIMSQLSRENINCIEKYPEWEKQDNTCYMSDSQERVEVALVGDSYAGHLRFGLQDQFNRAGINYNLFTVSCQLPGYGFRSAIDQGRYGVMRSAGAKLRDRAFEDQLKNPATSVFVFAHNPECSYGGSLGQVYDDIEPANNTLSDEEKWLVAFRRTMNMLKEHGKKALFVLPNPYLPFESFVCRKRPFSDSQICDYPVQDARFAELYGKYREAVKQIVSEYDNADLIDLADYFCDESKCYLIRNGRLMYHDKGHLNFNGSLYVAPHIYDKIRKLMDR